MYYLQRYVAKKRATCTHEEDGEDSTVQLGVDLNSNPPPRSGLPLRPSERALASSYDARIIFEGALLVPDAFISGSACYDIRDPLTCRHALTENSTEHCSINTVAPSMLLRPTVTRITYRAAASRYTTPFLSIRCMSHADMTEVVQFVSSQYS